MRIKNWSFLYSLGYAIVFQGTKGFYKKVQVVGKENIPKDKPILFAANHQNAFMDPVVIAVQMNKPVYYMVRADIFKKPAVAKILASINMMPIFRQRDGGNTIEKNKAVFDNCFDLLKEHRPIIIFVEGNQGKQKKLRPIQKGVFRIGLGAENKYDNELDVHIVPVGLYYSDTVNMGSKMLINFGKPIRLQDYITKQQENEVATLNELKDELGIRMSECMVDIQNTEYYDTIHDLMFILEQDIYNYEGVKPNSLYSEFNCQKGYIAKAEKWVSENAAEAIKLKEDVSYFQEEVFKSELRPWLFEKEKHSTFLNVLLLTLAAPFHLFGIVNSYLPYKIPANFVKNKVKDIHFHSSIKMAMSVILFWLFWGIQTLLVAIFTGHYIWAYYLISLPITAWISYHYWILLLKTKGMMKFNKLNKANDKKFLKLKENYGKLKVALKDIYKA